MKWNTILWTMVDWVLNRWKLLAIIFFFFSKLTFTGFTSFFADLLPRLGCWYAAVHIHNLLLGNVFRLPNNFFDVTPTGRILARFSKDVDVVDTTIPQLLSDLINCAFEVKTLTFYHKLFVLFNLQGWERGRVLNFLCCLFYFSENLL